jgi:uncharacterized membrane protein YvlD (DUF360 family)
MTAAGHRRAFRPPRPIRFSLVRLFTSWVSAALAFLAAAAVLPGVHIPNFLGALVTVALVAILNAILPPLVAALRLPFMLGIGFVLVLLLDAAMLVLASQIDSALHVDSFWWALAAAILAAAFAMVIEVVAGTSDDDYALRVARRVARRQGMFPATDAPGLVLLEIDGLGLPILRRAMRDGNAPEMARWLEQDTHSLVEWETDTSSQTGASQAGILLGDNHDIPAFRWVEKETGRMRACSNPGDCEHMEKGRAGNGLLAAGGASRGNLFSGEADEVILTVSRLSAEKRANPGYRAFLADGSNVTRTLVLFVWEVWLEVLAALRSRRRDVRPRGHRGGIYPFLRATMCVVVRDLIVHGVVTDIMRGRPVIYATFSSYDEVAHHSGLERADTLEALRKLDNQIAWIARAVDAAPRPYHLVVLSDHGQTQGATFKQRNGYGLDELVARSVEAASVAPVESGDEHNAAVGQAVGEATGREPGKAGGTPEQAPAHEVIVLGSGNLGLVYLMNEPRRLTLEEIEERHPRLIPALREHPHVGFIMIRSAEHGAVVLGAEGTIRLQDGSIVGSDPLAPFGPGAAGHLARTDEFSNAPDILVNSFYDPELDQGCAFEELISFHGGMGGAQTRPFLLVPAGLPVPDERIVGAAGVHQLLCGWRDRSEPGWRERARDGAVSAPADAEQLPR